MKRKRKKVVEACICENLVYFTLFLRQLKTTDKHDNSTTMSEPVCFTEENTDKNLSTNNKYEDEVKLVDSNSLS